MGKVANDAAADQPTDQVEADYLIPKSAMHGRPDSETEVFRRWRADLRDESGQSFDQLKDSLRPRYGQVWMQLLSAYLLIVVTVVCLVTIQPGLAPWWQNVLVGLLAGIPLGYLVAFIALWLHEAAHYNLYPSRGVNDLLANIFSGMILMHDVRGYRRIHFLHHRHLGEVDDTERSYFYPLNLRYFLESLTGIRVLRLLLERAGAEAQESKAGRAEQGYFNWASPVGALMHLTILGGSVYFQQYALAVAWVFGVSIFYPFFGALRPALEHRKPDADPLCDYSTEPHGAYTRTFEPGLISATFGGAGFNRHLIHHWDPGISCTCFPRVERFLEQSQLRDFYLARKTTYREALVTLLRGSRRGMSGAR